MKASSEFATLLKEGRRRGASELLREGAHLVTATGERSARAGLEAATRICLGELSSTIFFMNKIHPWLDDQTPLERAEQSDEGLAFVIDMIGAIEAGVYI